VVKSLIFVPRLGGVCPGSAGACFDAKGGQAVSAAYFVRLIIFCLPLGRALPPFCRKAAIFWVNLP
jgi:hypothetical protein